MMFVYCFFFFCSSIPTNSTFVSNYLIWAICQPGKVHEALGYAFSFSCKYLIIAAHLNDSQNSVILFTHTLDGRVNRANDSRENLN